MVSKIVLYEWCLNWANDKINGIKLAIESAQDSANSETKSTAGDKHDTARAMMQLDVEQKSKQLHEAEKNKMTMSQFSTQSGTQAISLGSLVETNAGMYYISISAGKIELPEGIVYAISPVSPIAQAMNGLKEGATFSFNGRQFTILSVS